MADDQRIYSDEEFALILRTAAELASRAEQPGFSSDGLTLTEIRSAAAQAGLDPALVERAATLLDTRATISPLERLVGGPLRHEHDAHFPSKLDEDSAARLLSAVRISTHFHSLSPGRSNALGMSWKALDSGNVLSVIARPDADGTSVSVALDRRGPFVLTGVATSIGVFASLVVATAVNSAAPSLTPWVAFGGIAGTMALARSFWASSTSKARARIGAFMDTIGEMLVRLDNQAVESRSAGEGTASPARDANVGADAERTGQ